MATARSTFPLRLTQSVPAAEVEDSIQLRVLVQLLVTLGISSVAVAASGVTDTSQWNLLAIPLSAVGALFSWQRRRYRNVAVKFFIAIGMLMALAAFFNRLIAQPGDTRIVLAELLIQLQVLHSFDLPRRKDLGYSMIIGLILLGVAATISQTLAFAPLLLLFLAVAIPVLMLDYQSRLHLQGLSLSQVKSWASVRKLVGITALTLGLGMLIFLFLPRLPGYQIQNFPVSSTIETQEDFSGEAIINPGYVSGDTENEAEGEFGGGSGDDTADIQESGKLTGPGVIDTTSYYGFNRIMNQNLRGEMTPQVVMRVRSQAPGFFRVLAFDRYNGQGWEISRNNDTTILRRPSFSYRILLPRVPNLNRDREVVQTYTLVTDFPNLIPSLYQAEEIYFPTREIAIDPEGGLRAPVGLAEGLTYTVVSDVPYRDRTALGQAPTGYSEAITTHYLQIPDTIRDRVKARAEELLANSPTPLTNPYEKTLFLAQALKQNYTLQPDIPFFISDQDLVETFLFTTEGGYADHFSTVLAVMLRSIDIPARVVTGFGPGEFNPFTGFYIIRNTDAYALTEVYFPQYGWFAFDPIPGHELLPPSIRESDTFSTVRQFWNWLAGWLPSPVVGFVDGLMNLATQGLIRLVQLFNGLLRLGWLGILISLAGLTALGFLAWLAFLGLRQGRRRWQLQQLPPIERLYQQMLTSFMHQGIPKRSSETPLEYGQRLYAKAKAHQAQAANEIAHAYVRWRYGGEPQNLAYLGEKLRIVQRQRKTPTSN
jgi:transglutaminase-like putative cysteine protease